MRPAAQRAGELPRCLERMAHSRGGGGEGGGGGVAECRPPGGGVGCLLP